MFCRCVLLLSSVSISLTMRLEATCYSETIAILYHFTHRHVFTVPSVRISHFTNYPVRKRGGNETVNLLETAKSLSLSLSVCLSLSPSLGFLCPAQEESFNRHHKFQRGSCGAAIYQRLHHETVLQNAPYSLVSPRF